MRVDHEKKSDGLRVNHEIKMKRWEFTIRKSDGVRKDHEKERWGES